MPNITISIMRTMSRLPLKRSSWIYEIDYMHSISSLCCINVDFFPVGFCYYNEDFNDNDMSITFHLLDFCIYICYRNSKYSHIKLKL